MLPLRRFQTFARVIYVGKYSGGVQRRPESERGKFTLPNSESRQTKLEHPC